MIDGKTKLFALLGHPVQDSLSPYFQNIFFQETTVNGAYMAFDLLEDQLASVLHGLYGLGVRGMNITAPYKEKVIPYLHALSATAAACGAVNTLVWTADGYVGDNTDGEGLLLYLQEEFAWSAAGQTVLLVGAGGSAKSIAYALLAQGCQTLIITNRTKEKAEILAKGLQELGFPCKVLISDFPYWQESQYHPEIGLIIQTTSCGLLDPGESLPIDLAGFSATCLVVDLIYQYGDTHFVTSAKSRGLIATNGLGMLVYQGALSFTKWTGITPDRQKVLQQVEEYIKKSR